MAKTHIQRWAPQDWRTSRVRARSAMTGDYMLRLVYLEALSALYEAGGYLQADPRLLADELLLPPEEIARCLPILDELARSRSGRGGLLIGEDGRISNPRVLADLADEQAFREQQAEHGKRSGEVRRGRSGKVASTDLEATLNPPSPLPTPSPAPTPAPSPSPLPDPEAARALARVGAPGELEALQAEVNGLLLEVSREIGVEPDVLLTRASRTPSRSSIVNVLGCTSLPWLRTTRDRLLGERAQHRADREPTGKAKQGVDRIKALVSGGMRDE